MRWGAVLLESEHLSRNTSHCRQKFLQQNNPVILSVNLRSEVHKYEFTQCIQVLILQQTPSVTGRCAHAHCATVVSLRYSYFSRNGQRKDGRSAYLMGSDSKNILICEPDSQYHCRKSAVAAAALSAVNGQLDQLLSVRAPVFMTLLSRRC